MVFFIYYGIIPSLLLYAGIAQLVEHMSRKHEAMSSILIASTIYFEQLFLMQLLFYLHTLEKYGIIINDVNF